MKISAIIAALLITISAKAQVSDLRFEDKIRIREAMDISSNYGDQLWEGYSAVPFAIVLVTDSIEFLINHPYPSSDFKLLGNDEILQTPVYYRKRQFSPHFLATFPAVNGLSCIVVGTPENTNKNSTEWIITLLHEHFHQYQNSYPDYFESVNNLDLANGDQTGMWMLNYPFPYDSSVVIKQYDSYSKALHEVIVSQDSTNLNGKLIKYFLEREKLKEVLTDADYRYFSLQVWQEGLARYSEYKYLELLKDYTPSQAVSQLSDFESFAALKIKMFDQEMKKLYDNELNDKQRLCFYSIGFAEGMVLDMLNPEWKKNYLKNKFYIENYSPKFKQS